MSDDETAPADDKTWAVLHLFAPLDAGARRGEIDLALKECRESGTQVVTVALLGHKADLGIVALGEEAGPLRRLQSESRRAGVAPSYSYVSRTEVSEYAAGIPAEMREARLHPHLPPEAMPAFCFYPMSKRRDGDDNWYRLGYDERLALMHGHGAVGRKYRGRVVQLITGSTGLDDYEWGVTLFGRGADDLKACVYEMRFDEASSRYAEFGPFLTGTVGEADQVLDALGCS